MRATRLALLLIAMPSLAAAVVSIPFSRATSQARSNCPILLTERLFRDSGGILQLQTVGHAKTQIRGEIRDKAPENKPWMSVLLNAVVDVYGRVRDARFERAVFYTPTRPTDEKVNTAQLETDLSRWRFAPPRLHAQPVCVYFSEQLNYYRFRAIPRKRELPKLAPPEPRFLKPQVPQANQRPVQ